MGRGTCRPASALQSTTPEGNRKRVTQLSLLAPYMEAKRALPKRAYRNSGTAAPHLYCLRPNMGALGGSREPGGPLHSTIPRVSPWTGGRHLEVVSAGRPYRTDRG